MSFWNRLCNRFGRHNRPIEPPSHEDDQADGATDDPVAQHIRQLRTQIAQTPEGPKRRALVLEYLAADETAMGWRANNHLSSALTLIEDNDKGTPRVTVKVDEAPVAGCSSELVEARILAERFNELLGRTRTLRRFAVGDIDIAKALLVLKNGVGSVDVGRTNFNDALLLALDGAKHVFGNVPCVNDPRPFMQRLRASPHTSFADHYSKRLCLFNAMEQAESAARDLETDFRELENLIALLPGERCWTGTGKQIKDADTVFTSTARLCSAFEEAEVGGLDGIDARSVLRMLTTEVYCIWVDCPQISVSDSASANWPSIIQVMRENGSNVVTVRERTG